MTITVTPLTERFGAEISGVDLTNLSTETLTPFEEPLRRTGL